MCGVLGDLPALTAAASGLALLPLVWRGNIPGREIEFPMAVVIFGGLITSTLLNVFMLPVLYVRFARGGATASIAPAMPTSDSGGGE